MCDHLECHGGKVKIRRVTCRAPANSELTEWDEWTQWEASPGDWFPFAATHKFEDLIPEVKKWLKDNEGIDW